MGIASKEVKIGICDACARTIIQDEQGTVPGFVGEVEDTRGGEPVEFFACSLPHVGKAITKLVNAAKEEKPRRNSRRGSPDLDRPHEQAARDERPWTDPPLDDATPAYNSMQGTFNGR